MNAPITLDINGRTYYRMEKEGINLATGLPARCYTCTYEDKDYGKVESRAWLVENASIEMDD